MSKIETAFAAFDNYNQQDPNSFEWKGERYPQEYFFALKLHNWVKQLEPDASEALLLASRSQHIGRWEIPRESYPEGREAYLKWRKDLSFRHAEIAAKLLTDVGYNDEEIACVKQIILKKKLKADPEVQIMENALCLVFLEYQYESFIQKHEPEKVINVLRKSLLKMDSNGHKFAMGLDYSLKGSYYIKTALAF